MREDAAESDVTADAGFDAQDYARAYAETVAIADRPDPPRPWTSAEEREAWIAEEAVFRYRLEHPVPVDCEEDVPAFASAGEEEDYWATHVPGPHLRRVFAERGPRGWTRTPRRSRGRRPSRPRRGRTAPRTANGRDRPGAAGDDALHHRPAARRGGGLHGPRARPGQHRVAGGDGRRGPRERAGGDHRLPGGHHAPGGAAGPGGRRAGGTVVAVVDVPAPATRDPVEADEVPAFATLEEAEAWHDAHRPSQAADARWRARPGNLGGRPRPPGRQPGAVLRTLRARPRRAADRGRPRRPAPLRPA